MSIDNLPNIPPVNLGGVVDRRRPILSYLSKAAGPHRAAAHQHPRAQLICPTRGAYWVATPQGSWLVPPNQAVWIPPNVYHEVFSHDSVTALMLFVDIAYAGPLPRKCVAVKVSPLLLELLKKVVECGHGYAPEGRELHLTQVILDELNEMAVAPFFLPMTQERRLRRVMKTLLDHPADERSLDMLAKEAGASSRTMARLFRKETGMTFPQWKTQLRLIEAIDRLSQGQSVTQVTFDLGYSSASAFIYMFRHKLGVTPGEYLRTQM